MTMREPGVQLVESTQLPPAELMTAVPVFIGNVESVPARLNAGLYPVQSLEQWSDEWKQLETAEESPLYWTVRHYFDNGGGPCFVLPISVPKTLADLCQAEQYAPVLSEPTISLVAMPDLGGMINELPPQTDKHAPPGQNPVALDQVARAHIAVWQAVLSACQSRSDLFFVLDAPQEPEDARDCIELLRRQGGLGERGQYVALYGPYLKIDYKVPNTKASDLNDFITVPPCGAVVSVIQRTDQEEGIWKAPANVALANVVEPEYREAKAREWFHESQLTINPIRGFPGRGVRVWGCRTLASNVHGPLHYVQVRRLITYIETNLAEICRFATFEPNNEITWFKLKGLSSAWLRKLWHRGGLAGTEESQAFGVLVGPGESMTAADLAAGRLIVKARVAVLQPAEFIDVKLVFNLSESQLASVAPQFNVSPF